MGEQLDLVVPFTGAGIGIIGLLVLFIEFIVDPL